MFQSATKPQEHIAGPETLREVAERAGVPLVAIGGITPANAGEVLAAGAQAVAVCQAVIGQADAAAAARAFRAGQMDAT
jgi:thiamine monophosphate synthase